jgi:DNA-binding response OmpR family regulator
MRVLIVEDDEDVSASLKTSLEAETFSVDTAFDGERGSYLARTNDYDLVILDYMLPKKMVKQFAPKFAKPARLYRSSCSLFVRPLKPKSNF